MGYEFIRDIHIEYPFYQQMAELLKGYKLKKVIQVKETYKVECPCCKKRSAFMYLGKLRDTFIFYCHYDQCSLKELNLHELIKRYGREIMFEEWRKASWKTTYKENWFPIKNKVQ